MLTTADVNRIVVKTYGDAKVTTITNFSFGNGSRYKARRLGPARAVRAAELFVRAARAAAEHRRRLHLASMEGGDVESARFILGEAEEREWKAGQAFAAALLDLGMRWDVLVWGDHYAFLTADRMAPAVGRLDGLKACPRCHGVGRAVHVERGVKYHDACGACEGFGTVLDPAPDCVRA